MKKFKQINLKIGFGCSNIGSNLNEKQSLQILNYSFKKNIKFFDLAPSYGDGNCHSIFNKFLRNKRRNDLFISTKIGEIENKKITQIRKFVPNFKIIKKIIKFFLPNISTTKKLKFNKKNIKKIVDSYLQELDIQYLDCIFLHNIIDIIEIENYYKVLINFKKEGKLKNIGISLNQNTYIPQYILNKFDYIQMENSLNSKNYEISKRYYNFFNKKIIFYGINSDIKIVQSNSQIVKFLDKINSNNFRLANLIYNLKVNTNSITLINTSKPERVDEIVNLKNLINNDNELLRYLYD